MARGPDRRGVTAPAALTEGYTRRRAIRGDGIEIPQRTVAKGAGAYGPTGAPEARAPAEGWSETP
jgi:hypothetical protein